MLRPLQAYVWDSPLGRSPLLQFSIQTAGKVIVDSECAPGVLVSAVAFDTAPHEVAGLNREP